MTKQEEICAKITDLGAQYQELTRKLIEQRNLLCDENAYLKALVAVYEAKLATLRANIERAPMAFMQ